MSDRVDRILDLIDAGLLDNSRQSSPEPAMPLDSLLYPYQEEYVRAMYPGGRVPERPHVREHVCVPECEENAHVAGPVTVDFAVRAMDAYAERLAHQVALDAEVVYVQLHTSEPRTPDTEWTQLGGITGWVLMDGDEVIASGEIR